PQPPDAQDSEPTAPVAPQPPDAQDSEQTAPVASDPGFSGEAPTVTQPVVPSAPEPSTPEAEAPESSAPEAPAASQNEPTEQFTHRFPENNAAAAFGATAAAGTSTQQLPAFTEQGQSETAAPPKPKRKRGRTALIAGSVLLLGAAGGFAGAAGYDAANGGDSGVVNSLNTKDSGQRAATGAVEKVAKSVLPSVVQINVKGSSESGSGTGIIISSDGQILTNNHVVEGAADSGTITVSFNDGSISRAEILGRDPVTDLAVIKAKDKSGLTPATLGSSNDLQVGQEVVAIGSPFGLESTVTSGIVSALNRPVSSSNGSGDDQGTVFPAVQTDAAINPGNSGGPLVDLDGRVVAINSAIRTNGTSSADSGSIGLGFAIPIDLAKNVSKHLVKGEKVEHARIGITVGNSVEEDGITTIGAEIKDVTSGGAGDKAGLKKGDIVTALNGNAVNGADALVASIRGYEPGEKVELTYLRDGKKKTTDVTLSSDGGNLGS
ncbi:MAG: trypsin-like peptidase domain-containing protein, partial [Actinomycetota bacterium]|nr:trypsin-like peptidase domain-containing protein [Actinomycetota bacterium]